MGIFMMQTCKEQIYDAYGQWSKNHSHEDVLSITEWQTSTSAMFFFLFFISSFNFPNNFWISFFTNLLKKTSDDFFHAFCRIN